MAKKEIKETAQVEEQIVENIEQPLQPGYYKVNEGDTLQKISILYTVGVQKLKVLNKINEVKPGDIIKIR